MIAFRFHRPDIYKLSASTLSILSQPFLALLFLFFLSSSIDLLHVYFILFKLKLTNAIAALFLFFYLLNYRSLHFPKKIFVFILLALGCMAVSLPGSPNRYASAGYLIFFLFNFLTYFSIPYNLFRFVNPKLLFEIYSKSFFAIGIYALCQVVFSLGGTFLPGVTQYIFSLARGQAFAYEPSFYALYMTPFAMFCNAKYVLQNPQNRKIKEIFWPNLFLLASTSTGCFFSYLFFLFFLVCFKALKIFDSPLSISKIFLKFSITFAAVLGSIWALNKNLIVSGFLKLFYSDMFTHFTVQSRWTGIVNYWNVFLDHPWIGLGLGSVPTYLLWNQGENVDVLDPVALEGAAPMNVTTEILASLGILGAVVFLFFFSILIQSFRSVLKENISEEERKTVIAFAISLCVLFSTLQFSQSIMRPYMWIHVGLFLGYINSLRSINRNSTSSS